MVAGVSHNHVARGVHGDAVRIAEESRRADPIGRACRAAARERDDGLRKTAHQREEHENGDEL